MQGKSTDQGVAMHESRFETRRGTLVWTDMPGRIRVEAPAKLSWPRRCVVAAVLATGCGLWGWVLLHLLRWML